QMIRGNESTPFAVGRYNCGDVRFHAGWMRNDEQRFIAGVDFPIHGDFSGGVDYTGGDSGALWAGVWYAIPGVKGLTANVNFGLPNDRSPPTPPWIGFFYGFRH